MVDNYVDDDRNCVANTRSCSSLDWNRSRCMIVCVMLICYLICLNHSFFFFLASPNWHKKPRVAGGEEFSLLKLATRLKSLTAVGRFTVISEDVMFFFSLPTSSSSAFFPCLMSARSADLYPLSTFPPPAWHRFSFKGFYMYVGSLISTNWSAWHLHLDKMSFQTCSTEFMSICAASECNYTDTLETDLPRAAVACHPYLSKLRCPSPFVLTPRWREIPAAVFGLKI